MYLTSIEHLRNTPHLPFLLDNWFAICHSSPSTIIHRYIFDAETTNEIQEYIQARYPTVSETAWSIFGFHVNQREPSVSALPVHLFGELPSFSAQRECREFWTANLEGVRLCWWRSSLPQSKHRAKLSYALLPWALLHWTMREVLRHTQCTRSLSPMKMKFHSVMWLQAASELLQMATVHISDEFPMCHQRVFEAVNRCQLEKEAPSHKHIHLVAGIHVPCRGACHFAGLNVCY